MKNKQEKNELDKGLQLQFSRPLYQPFLKSNADKEFFELLVKKSGITDKELKKIKKKSLNHAKSLRQNFVRLSNIPITFQGVPFNRYYSNHHQKDGVATYTPEDPRIFIPTDKPGWQDAEVHVEGAGTGYWPKPVGDDDDLNKIDILFESKFSVPESGTYSINAPLYTMGLYSVISNDDAVTTKAATCWIDVSGTLFDIDGTDLTERDSRFNSGLSSRQFFTEVGNMFGALSVGPGNPWFSRTGQNISEQYVLLITNNIFGGDRLFFDSKKNYKMRIFVTACVYARGEGASADLVITQKIGGGVFCPNLILTPS